MPKSERDRFSSKRKRKAFLRRFKGEGLDLVSRDICVTGATLGKWREALLEGGLSGYHHTSKDQGESDVYQLADTEDLLSVALVQLSGFSASKSADEGVPFRWSLGPVNSAPSWHSILFCGPTGRDRGVSPSGVGSLDGENRHEEERQSEVARAWCCLAASSGLRVEGS